MTFRDRSSRQPGPSRIQGSFVPKVGVAIHALVKGLLRYPTAVAVYRLMPRAARRGLLEWVNKCARDATGFGHLPGIPGSSPAPHPASKGDAGVGVNIYGHLRGEFGLAESARRYAIALLEAGVPVALNDLPHDVPHAFGDLTLSGDLAEHDPHATSIFFVNPDYLERAFEFAGTGAGAGAGMRRRVVGCWFWELERVPDTWRCAIDSVDAIMVASSFVENAFRHVTTKPIIRVPLPLRDVAASGASRQDFGLPDDRFVFLTSFDFNSSVHRKNPAATIAAFKKAFSPDRDDVVLLVKSSNGHRYPDQLLQLMGSVAGDPRIFIRDQILPMAHMRALQQCSDAYVSLHRAEGFGLGLAECMAMGKPVIATAWSGNVDFMREGNSCLVDYRLVPVGSGEYPHGEGSCWAEPDIEHAAEWMRRLVGDPALATRIGRKAAEDVRTKLSSRSVADAIMHGLRATTASEGSIA